MSKALDRRWNKFNIVQQIHNIAVPRYRRYYKIAKATTFDKLDIVQHMAAARQYRRYLEISTTTTGFRFTAAREAGFEDCVRCVYKCSEEFSDGEPIHFRSADLDISACVSAIGARGSSFDVVFVDPHHTYECSLRDLREAFALIADGGALVVHDCDPPTKRFAGPDFVPGPWCGTTYKAFIDFVLGREDLEYCTVDTDFGCGVIIKRSSGPRPRALPAADDARPAGRQLIANWRAVGNNFDAAFDLFARERASLLQLVSVDSFRNAVRADVSD
jgi:Methyltransferase domain